MLDNVLIHLPAAVRAAVASLPASLLHVVEEIRIREERPLEIVYDKGCAFVTRDGRQTAVADDAYRPTHEECRGLLELLTRHSFYSFEEELKRGYITMPGGHRVGLAGQVVLEGGQVKHIREVSSFNIRIARELKGAGSPLLPYLIHTESGCVHHTLVVSPPQQGKTTLIRDLARLISSGEGISSVTGGIGYKVGVVDERSEIAAAVKGVPKFDLGPRTDVLDACPKAEGMMMMIRSMSPEVLIVDEIGRPEDAEAIHEAVHAGIRIIATAHGRDLADIRKRPVLRGLLADGVFGRCTVLGRSGGGQRNMQVYDAAGKLMAALSPPSLSAASSERRELGGRAAMGSRGLVPPQGKR
ncbi:stage III sporulation protein AA [Paenibacillus lutrae]|uniref:Stage III sporulation protein AA n=1 Tax=Paenibacillus lutrae TaxID=2078573 RepID=A0A7X3FI15_9BACL|nr:stage III sporulation protein AA [Paenibacillus lutrae]MVP00166.1 stage III sporulation protein AA [Paenibacillus lutrae]